jgi:predicted HTH transcriptional regulator
MDERRRCVTRVRGNVQASICSDYNPCLVQVFNGGMAICEKLLDWEARGEAKPAIEPRRKMWSSKYPEILEIIKADLGNQVTAHTLATRLGIKINTASSWLSRMAKRGMIKRIGKSGSAFIYHAT